MQGGNHYTIVKAVLETGRCYSTARRWHGTGHVASNDAQYIARSMGRLSLPCFSEATSLISTKSDIRGKICPHRCGHLIWVITSELKSLFHTKLKLNVTIFLRKVYLQKFNL